jgi:nitrogen regulatory protein PII
LKLITAVIPQDRLEDVKDALKAEGVTGLTVTLAQGFGRRGGEKKIWRGAEHVVDLQPKLRLEMVVPGRAEAERVVNVLVRSTGPGPVGEGKVWVGDVDWVVSLRTGEMNDDAL